ncbi:hypothetical protein [Burkholderia glumae]|uniref:hypothetical protein n=1 Tax=Burkholderia glumae TaxID=337 RepID=UPI00214F890F|nr:hypothetical protein [Burkholderia glumae]
MNCKPGDLAIVVHSPWAPENIGRIVEVTRRRIGEKQGPSWLVRADRVLVERWEDGRVRMVYERFYLDACLRPVSGIPMTDDVTDEVTA